MHNPPGTFDDNGSPLDSPPARSPVSLPSSSGHLPSEAKPSSEDQPEAVSELIHQIQPVRVETPLLITDDMLAEAEPVDTRRDFERGMSCFPPLTLALIFVNVVVFAWQVISGALQSQTAIVEAGALAREPVLQGEVWRLLSAMFLHGGGDHLIGNCVVLFIVGMACEHALGLGGAAWVYFLSGLAGSLLSVMMSPGPSVGASGAIFGVTGSVISFLYKHQNQFYVRDARIGWVLAFWALYSIGTGFLDPYVDNFAHIGGFLAGCFITLFLRPAMLSRLKA